jgi:uncharacterized protein YkwD
VCTASASADLIGTSGCADANITPTRAVFGRAAAATLCLVNEQRRSAGRPALRRNGALNIASKRMARRMARQHFVSHVTPDGLGLLDRVRAAGFHGNVVGENLGWGNGGLATPAAMVLGWMQSPGHRRNILDGDYADIGIGLAVGALSAGDSRGAYYVTDFGH